MNGKVLLVRNDNYQDGAYTELWFIAIPVDMVLSALSETGIASLYRCDGLDGYGYRSWRKVSTPNSQWGSFRLDGYDGFATQLSHNVHNGKEWVGGLIHGLDWILPCDIYSDFDLSDMNEQREQCHTLTITECEPTERALRKALKAQGWRVVSKVPKKYLEYDPSPPRSAYWN